MCGIFGIVSSVNTSCTREELVDLARKLFLLAETRGRESAGIALFDLSGSERRLLKEAVSASQFVKGREFERLTTHTPLKGGAADRQPSTAVLGHTRLVTNGNEYDNRNNQPVSRDGGALVHNGILVNVEDLWTKQRGVVERCFEVDSEYLLARINQLFNGGTSVAEAVWQTFQEIRGAASVAFVPAGGNIVGLATNNGSLYWLHDLTSGLVIFASERYMLSRVRAEVSISRSAIQAEINRLQPNTCALILPSDVSPRIYPIGPERLMQNGNCSRVASIKPNFLDLSKYCTHTLADPSPALKSTTVDQSLLEYRLESIGAIRRCSKCILPETFPFIEFDSSGVCNYCSEYRPIQRQPIAQLEQILESVRRSDSGPDCLVTFSGGRDSSYGLHLVRTKYRLNPIAYTYDWGMVTDLARRNQSRLTAKLGIEHILVSADIRRKRENIRMNVTAWLRRPHLGTVPLFMAGDKQYFSYANKLGKLNGLNLIILCENQLETTAFKSGFCGIPPNRRHTYDLPFLRKIQMIMFYGFQALRNPAYINRSVVDTLSAFNSYYFTTHAYLNLYEYERWDESTVNTVLREEYDWELSSDTASTWRIGDGTAAFYNYIYFTVAGFSEYETFRSNQIREGSLTREAALDLVLRENRPRAESIRWYLKTIGLDFDSTIRCINGIAPLYRRSGCSSF